MKQAHLFNDFASFLSLHLHSIVYEPSTSAEEQRPASFVCHEMVKVGGRREELQVRGKKGKSPREEVDVDERGKGPKKQTRRDVERV